MQTGVSEQFGILSPSMRREWIEIFHLVYTGHFFNTSPSMRREWIEMPSSIIVLYFTMPSPSMRREWIEIQCLCVKTERSKSPSMRREWIEIDFVDKINLSFSSLPPCGGSGLKSPRMYTLFQQHSLPPCGGSGLK